MRIIEQVESILKFSKEARNSDRELLIIYMQKSGMGLTDEQIKIFKKMPSMETLRRSRQHLQEQGKYLADERVREARQEKAIEVRRDINYTDPETLLEQQGYKVLEWGE